MGRVGRPAASQAVEAARGLSRCRPKPSLVAGRLVGDGDAAVGHHHDRHHRTGLRERHALPAVLLRPADRDDHPFAHAGAVLSQGEHLHRLPVPREAIRSEDAHVHVASLPVLSKPVVQRRHLGSGRGHVGDPRAQPHADMPAHRRADDDLHDVWRGAGRRLHRREADGLSSSWRWYRRRRPGDRSARFGRVHRRAARGRHDGPHADVRFSFRPHRAVHVLVGHDCGAVSLPVLLRHRSEPGAAVSVGQVPGRGAHLASRQRLLEDSAPGARAPGGRAHLHVLPVHPAADALQLGPRWASAGQ